MFGFHFILELRTEQDLLNMNKKILIQFSTLEWYDNPTTPLSYEYEINTNSAIALIPMLVGWMVDDVICFQPTTQLNSQRPLTHRVFCMTFRGVSSIKEKFAHLL